MKLVKIIFVNIFFITIGIVFLEIGLGKWVFKKDKRLECLYLICNANFNFRGNFENL